MDKDGKGLCKLFGEIIDHVEEKYNCIVIYFITDADGGSLKGRILLEKERPYVLVSTIMLGPSGQIGIDFHIADANLDVVSARSW